MISAILGEVLPYIVAGLAAIAAFWGYGRRERKRGRDEVVTEIEKADRETATGVKEKLDAVATDGDALERLRKHGKLRD